MREVTESRLLGRGGAAFPTGTKWEAVARQPAEPHYVVCNADESEPGTFKDRVLMESDPFAVVEAITIAGLATGSSKGFLYVRAEYPLAHRRLAHAIEASQELLNGFEIELRIGAGAYVCGEETALFQSIEGFRGEPRNKPPFPVEVGLFGKPTAVNNVETLLNVLEVLRDGGATYAATGTEGSTGTRLFCVSGCVERPGLYELPFGATLRELLDLAGAPAAEGRAAGRRSRRVRRPGAARSEADARGHARGRCDARFRRRDRLRRGGGAGAARCFGSRSSSATSPAGNASRAASARCGRKRPSAAWLPAAPHEDELQTLAEIAQVMRDASICGLGQTAASAVTSAIENLGVFAS